MNQDLSFRPGMCVHSYLFMKQMEPRRWNNLTSALTVFFNHSKIGPKRMKKKSTILKYVTFFRTVEDMIKLHCYLSSKLESFVFFRHINSYSISSSLQILMKRDMHWRREHHLKSEPVPAQCCSVVAHWLRTKRSQVQFPFLSKHVSGFQAQNPGGSMLETANL